jgi:hypothetical protein
MAAVIYGLRSWDSCIYKIQSLSLRVGYLKREKLALHEGETYAIHDEKFVYDLM